MARIAGVEVPENKALKISLTYVFGIGDAFAKQIVVESGVDGDKKVKELSEKELNSVRSIVESNYKVEGELRQERFRNIKRLRDIKSYRGIRHKLGLPVRGQRTRANARTRKGRSMAVGGLNPSVSKK